MPGAVAVLAAGAGAGVGLVETVTGWFGTGVIAGAEFGVEMVAVPGVLGTLPSAGSGLPTSISQR